MEDDNDDGPLYVPNHDKEDLRGKISAIIEEGLKQKLKLWSHRKCRPEADLFVQCVKSHSVSFLWTCKPENTVYNACLGK
jgi:hypothetical protein